MKAKALQSIGRLTSKISNPSSLTSLYKSIELSNNKVRCCSEFGNLELTLDPTGLQNAVLLDADAVMAIASSLPPEADITIEEKGSKINWVCGNAKGHLNQVVTDYKIPEIKHPNHPWTPPAEFIAGLILASAACQAAAVSVGLYGIVIEPDTSVLQIMSSNTIALAQAKIDLAGYAFGKIVVRPPVPAVIASLMTACPGSKIDITKEGIFIEGSWLKAHLPLGADLQHNLKEIADKFVEAKITSKVDNKAVKRFLARAKVLSEKNSTFNVGLKVEAGKLSLIHSGITSSTEEYFLADGLDPAINYQTVNIPADMLMLPLEHIDSVVYDYLPTSRLVLKGSKPEFLYVIGGGE